jgi:hypothetical protein
MVIICVVLNAISFGYGYLNIYFTGRYNGEDSFIHNDPIVMDEDLLKAGKKQLRADNVI